MYIYIHCFLIEMDNCCIPVLIESFRPSFPQSFSLPEAPGTIGDWHKINDPIAHHKIRAMRAAASFFPDWKSILDACSADQCIFYPCSKSPTLLAVRSALWFHLANALAKATTMNHLAIALVQTCDSIVKSASLAVSATGNRSYAIERSNTMQHAPLEGRPVLIRFGYSPWNIERWGPHVSGDLRH